MKSVHRFIGFIAILTLILSLSGCASASLQVEKEIPAPPTQPISLTVTVAERVQMPAEDLNDFRTRIVERITWEGIRVVPNGNFAVMGTVTRYDPGSQFWRWFLGILSAPFSAGYFDSTWIVRDENDREIGNARITGDVYAGVFGGSYYRVLENVAERLAEFLTKTHKDPKPQTERAD